MQGVTDVILRSGLKFETTIRSNGNQIARQRNKIINFWYDNNKSDWLLWVDSDVVISPETFLKLWAKKDVLTKPLLTGVYFTSTTPEEPLMVPLPTVYNFVERGEEFTIKAVHPLPADAFMKVDAAGFGFVLMHRSVVERLRKAIPEETPLFAEAGVGNTFIGEDIYFFMLCGKAEIPVWCDTSALVPHMKRFSFDEHYYKAFLDKPKVQEKPKSKIILPK
jgi:hypothetical protein